MGTKVSGFGVERDFDKHVSQPAMHAHQGAKFFYTRSDLGKIFRYSRDVDDDATFRLPSITYNAFGWVVAGDDEERAFFTVSSTGTVTLIYNSANVVANQDTDLKLCLGTSASQEPLTVKNRLGSAKHVNLMLFYNVEQGRRLVRVIAETVQVVESGFRASKLIKVIAETLQITEEVLRPRNLVRLIAEVVQVVESGFRSSKLVKVLSEAVSIVKNIIKKLN
jgi:hypothetical protein